MFLFVAKHVLKHAVLKLLVDVRVNELRLSFLVFRISILFSRLLFNDVGQSWRVFCIRSINVDKIVKFRICFLLFLKQAVSFACGLAVAIDRL